MSTTAVVMMVVAMTLVWGGLLLALINIKRSPEEPDELDTPAEGEHTGHAAGGRAAPPEGGESRGSHTAGDAPSAQEVSANRAPAREQVPGSPS